MKSSFASKELKAKNKYDKLDGRKIIEVLPKRPINIKNGQAKLIIENFEE